MYLGNPCLHPVFCCAADPLFRAHTRFFNMHKICNFAQGTMRAVPRRHVHAFSTNNNHKNRSPQLKSANTPTKLPTPIARPFLNQTKQKKIIIFSPLQHHRLQFFKRKFQAPLFFAPLYFSVWHCTANSQLKKTKKIQKLFFFSPLQNHRFQFFKKPSQTPFFFPPLYFSL